MHDGAETGPGAALKFRDDPGATRAAWIAVGLVVIVAAWFASGLQRVPDMQPISGGDVSEVAVQVAVTPSAQAPVVQALVVEGQAVPDRETSVLAETVGKIAEVVVEKGDTVAGGAVLVRLDATERQAGLRRAEADLARAQLEFSNAQTLLDRGVGTLDRVAAARAVLAAAESQLANAKAELDDATIRAPFAGRIEELEVNDGEFVTTGMPVARIVDNAPLTVRARVAQQSVSRIAAGQPAEVVFITGETRLGTVAFIGTNADPQTRTFLLDVVVANEGGAIPAGISAEIRIATGETRAHFVSPALLSLDEKGVLGLKTVTAEDRVAFYPVSVVRAETGGVWVSGLPETVDIITVGQGFVRDGDLVVPSRVDARP